MTASSLSLPAEAFGNSELSAFFQGLLYYPILVSDGFSTKNCPLSPVLPLLTLLLHTLTHLSAISCSHVLALHTSSLGKMSLVAISQS